MSIITQYKSRNDFRHQLQLILILPIKQAIRESNKPLTYHIDQMSQNGFKLNYKSFENTLRGRNWNSYQFDYYHKLYDYFNVSLDVNTFAQLLTESIAYENTFRDLKSNDKRYKKLA